MAFPKTRAGQPNSDVEGKNRQNGDAKTGENGTSGGAVAVAFSQHIAEHIGQREEEECTVGNKGADFHTLGGGDIGNQKDSDKQREQGGEEARLNADERRFSGRNIGMFSCALPRLRTGTLRS